MSDDGFYINDPEYIRLMGQITVFNRYLSDTLESCAPRHKLFLQELISKYLEILWPEEQPRFTIH